MKPAKTIFIRFLTLLLLEPYIYINGADCGAVSQQEWGAMLHKPLVTMALPVDLVVIQHTVTPECANETECSQSVRDIQKAHINRRFDDIAQSFLVGGDKKIYEGRGWNHVGAHTLRYNDKSIGISFIGDFRDHLPTESSRNVLKEFLSCGVEKGFLTENYRIVGHRQLSQTLSPGDKLFEEIKTWQHWHNQ